jgi:Tfp pilus assembly protein PilO
VSDSTEACLCIQAWLLKKKVHVAISTCVCVLVHTFAHTCSPQRQHIGTACGPEREMRQKDSKLVAHVAYGAMKLAQRCDAAMS